MILIFGGVNAENSHLWIDIIYESSELTKTPIFGLLESQVEFPFFGATWTECDFENPKNREMPCDCFEKAKLYFPIKS